MLGRSSKWLKAVFNVSQKRFGQLTMLNSQRRRFNDNANIPLYANWTVLLAFFWPVTKQNNKSVRSGKDLNMESIIEKADILFQNRRYEECYQDLSKFEDENNAEILWRISRVLYNITKESGVKEEQKQSLIFNAYDIISRALAIDENNPNVHKWFAVLLDAKSTYIGISEKIKQVFNVKWHMKRAVILNPKDATTLYMLGLWCYEITDLPWYRRKIASTLFATLPESTYEEALDYFLKAETIEPRFYSLNLLMLGKTYLKLNKTDQAKYYLTLAASYPAKSNDDHRANKEATDLLKKMK